MNIPLRLLAAAALTVSVSACATAPESTTEAQRASCEQMLAMGEGATHSHQAQKTGGVSSMGMTHAECKRMLGR